MSADTIGSILMIPKEQRRYEEFEEDPDNIREHFDTERNEYPRNGERFPTMVAMYTIIGSANLGS